MQTLGHEKSFEKIGQSRASYYPAKEDKAVKFYARVQRILELADLGNLTTQLLYWKGTAIKGLLITSVTFH